MCIQERQLIHSQFKQHFIKWGETVTLTECQLVKVITRCFTIVYFDDTVKSTMLDTGHWAQHMNISAERNHSKLSSVSTFQGDFLTGDCINSFQFNMKHSVTPSL